ncbi:uncharacterized protein RCO7_02892 [Rhynchosporium graminicola]|uniref:Uncharacterized protein n=1 Tax=Rhynchosporium graminicola TaxID=2792576 RepID=A0A1E1LIK0_9HELO|nr:uncharacterized protein RCO7_02892 [Rhynchosporium commune]
MTGRTYDVDIELFDNSFEKEDDNYTTRVDSGCQSSDEDSLDDFQSCSQSLASRDSVDDDRPPIEQNERPENGRSVTPVQSGRRKSSSFSMDGSSIATFRESRLRSLSRSRSRSRSRDVNMRSGKLSDQNDQQEIRTRSRTPPTVASSNRPSVDENSNLKSQEIYRDFFPAGLKVIREIDSESARSPYFPSPTEANSASLDDTNNANALQNSGGHISLLDKFGRRVQLNFDQDGESCEVRVDEDGHHYIFGDEGLRVILKEGQIESDDDDSTAFCISGGKRVKINIIADRLRTSALQDPRPTSDLNEEPITPRTEHFATNNSNSLPSPLRNVSQLPISSNTNNVHTSNRRVSRNPWAGIFTGVATKSREVTKSLTKGARSRKRSSSESGMPDSSSAAHPDESRTSARKLSVAKSGLVTGETTNARQSLFGRSSERTSRRVSVSTFRSTILRRKG